jgi:hypothetical protein
MSIDTTEPSKVKSRNNANNLEETLTNGGGGKSETTQRTSRLANKFGARKAAVEINNQRKSRSQSRDEVTKAKPGRA